MNFQLKGRHVEGMEQMDKDIRAKVRRFDRLMPANAYVELQLTQFSKAHGNGHKEAEVLVDIPGKKPVIRFVAQGASFLEAVDLVLDKLDTELARQHQKLVDHSLRHQRPLKERVADAVNQEEL